MNVTLVQLNVLESPQDNIDKVKSLTKDIIDSIVVLPELFTTGFNYSLIDSLPVDHHEILNQLDNSNTYMGSIVRQDGKKRFNSFFIKTGDEIEFIYDKLHLFPLMDEDKHFSAGSRMDTFKIGNIDCAATICFDLRFPELFRKYFLNKAKVIFLPAEWPAIRKDHLMVLAKARAIENQCFIVLCNAVGQIWDEQFAGASVVIDPWGQVIADCGDIKDAVEMVNIDISVVNEIRARIPVSTFRRGDLYGN